MKGRYSGREENSPRKDRDARRLAFFLSSYSFIALSCLFSVDLRFQIKPVLRPAWFSLGVEFSPDEHLRHIPPLPYPFTPR